MSMVQLKETETFNSTTQFTNSQGNAKPARHSKNKINTEVSVAFVPSAKEQE